MLLTCAWPALHGIIKGPADKRSMRRNSNYIYFKNCTPPAFHLKNCVQLAYLHPAKVLYFINVVHICAHIYIYVCVCMLHVITAAYIYIYYARRYIMYTPSLSLSIYVHIYIHTVHNCTNISYNVTINNSWFSSPHQLATGSSRLSTGHSAELSCKAPRRSWARWANCRTTNCRLSSCLVKITGL